MDGTLDSLDSTLLDHGRHLGPYRIVRYLGSGGMGVVYEAIDEDLGDRVAIKTLRALDPMRLFRLKQEFRVVSGIRHDNLVRHDALFVEDGVWFLAMEFIDGVELRRAIQRAPQTLSSALAQLALGIHALHGAGVLHLDVKPGNVLVEGDGRVVLVDFGLAQARWNVTSTGSGRRRFAGTRGYIAPEVLAGEAPLPASDWYALGVILRELLHDMASAGEVIPADVESLTRSLLVDDPRARPTGVDVLHCLGAHTALHSQSLARPPLDGRAREKAAIVEAVASTQAGVPRLVRVIGASGIGKTHLVRHVLALLEERGEALVLWGRCHECESVPFGGLDAVLDGLVRYLQVHSGAWAESDVVAAATIFPVLLALVAPDARVERSAEDRQAVFLSVRRLLAAVAAGRRLVIALDDLHHARSDTAGLLLDLLLAGVDSLNLTIVTTQRIDSDGPCLGELATRAEARGQAIDERTIALGPLDRDACSALLRRRLGDLDPARIAALTEEVGGDPFLAEALADEGWMGPGSAVLALVERRLQALSDEARALLIAVSIAGAPLPQAVLLQASNAHNPRASLAALQAGALVRTQGPRRWDNVEPTHDRIGEGVRALVSEDERAHLHEALARALEQATCGTPELLVRHWRGAGDLDRASVWAVEAATEAEQALAFERAAAFLADAAMWSRDIERSATLRRSQGRALVRAGRCASAAEAFLAGATGESRAQALRLAADALMASGHVDRGLKILRPMLRAEGIAWPRTGLGAALALLGTYVRVRLRGLEPAPRSVTAQSEDRVRRVDLCWSVGMGLTNVMPVEGMLFILRALREALAAGEPGRIARGMAVFGAFHRLLGRATTGDLYLQRARALAEELADPQLLGLAHVCKAADAMLRGDWQAVLSDTHRGLAALAPRGAGMTWERVLGACFELAALDQLGALAEVERRASEHLRDAESRGDLYGVVVFSQFYAQSRIAAGDLTTARRYGRHGLERWTARSYTLQHFYALRIDVSCDLYEGKVDRATAALRGSWRHIERAGLLRNSLSRVDAILLRARCALARGDRREALGLARRLAGEVRPDARWHSQWIRARAATDDPNARALLETSTSSFKEAGMSLYAASCARRLVGEGAGTSDEAIRAAGVADPERWIGFFMP